MHRALEDGGLGGRNRNEQGKEQEKSFHDRMTDVVERTE
jgi:hypothetical protein